MESVVTGEPSGANMEKIMDVYLWHKATVNKYIVRGKIIGLGPMPTGEI